MINAKTYERGSIMSRDGFNYYDAYGRQASYFEEMGLNLASAIQRGELGTKELMDALHTFENDADAVNHEIQEHLVSDFVVPLERGGMNELANALDDVTDAIEDIAIEAYIRGVRSLPAGGTEMVGYLSTAVTSLRGAVEQLRGMDRKNTAIRECCLKVQTAESSCDTVFIESAHRVNASGEPFEQRHNSCAVIAAVERAMDAVETAAEIVEAVVAGNA